MEIGLCDICGVIFEPHENKETSYCDIHESWFKRVNVDVWANARRQMEVLIREKKKEFGRD